jgi:hypothetical protein
MNEVELACAVARRDFGPVVGRVVRALLQHPGLKYGEIRGRCAAPPPSQTAVDDSVAVLLMHGIAYAEARSAAASGRPRAARSLNPSRGAAEALAARKRGAGDAVPPNAVLSYKVRAAALLSRTRIPQYLFLMDKIHGAAARRIGMVLLQRGRVSAADVFALFGKEGMGKVELRKAEDTLIVLVKSGWVRWSGSLEAGPVGSGTVQVIPDDGEPEAAAGADELGDDSDGEAARAAAVERDAAEQRAFEVLTGDERDVTKPVFNRETGKLLTGRGHNRKFVDAPLASNSNDLWSVSPWFVDRVCRNATCQLVVSRLLGANSIHDQGPKVYRAGLNLAVLMEDPSVVHLNDGETEAVSFHDIQAELARGGYVLDGIDFQEAIQQILDVRPVIARVEPQHAPTSIVFLTGQVIFVSRYATVRQTVDSKYGLEGLRVWHALALHGCMEEKMLSDKTMMDIKSVREMLFRLMQGGYVTAQEVPKSNEPARAERSNAVWYLWRADMVATQQRILSDALATMLRLMLKAERVRATGCPDDAARARRSAKMLLLETTLGNVSQAVSLFRDFGAITDHYFDPLYEIIDDAYR